MLLRLALLRTEVVILRPCISGWLYLVRIGILAVRVPLSIVWVPQAIPLRSRPLFIAAMFSRLTPGPFMVSRTVMVLLRFGL